MKHGIANKIAIDILVVSWYKTDMKTSIAELKLLTDREMYYRIAERVEEYWAMQGAWDEVMAQKWQMNAYSDSNPFLGGSR